MKIATILPTKHLSLEADSDYHMCLAHLMNNDEYRKFFEWQVARGAHVIMDNGVVETGEPLPAHKLFEIAAASGITEMTLPDKINDRMVTSHLHASALKLQNEYYHRIDVEKVPESVQKVMLIPQGCDKGDWVSSVYEMLTLAKKYPETVSAIGISKFCVGENLFESRLEALQSVPWLINSDLDIHLLGCPGSPAEMMKITIEFPDRIRGVDSGLPVFYTLAGKKLTYHSDRPQGIELDFDHEFDQFDRRLLESNVRMWKRMIHWSGLH